MHRESIGLETTEVIMMSTTVSGGAGSTADIAHSRRGPARIPLIPLGISLSAFLAIGYLLCILLGLFGGWDWGLHQPWLQFLPGFTWLTWPSFFLGLAESIAYGWYTALLFGGLYNVALARFR
ncbi:MAG: hypothetical protein ACREU7_06280 [Burkholderiales bacterium]